MNKDLEQKLIKAAPLLYSNRYKNPKETCMCWGFECNDGWFDLLMEASVKIEAEINKYLEQYPSSKCGKCGCDVLEHDIGMHGDMPCKNTHYLPYHFGGWHCSTLTFCWHNIKQHIKSWYGIKYIMRAIVLKNIKKIWFRKINRIASWLYKKFNIGYYKPCWCKDFTVQHPRAAQIKEKFGTLRFYMTHYTDKIDEIIKEAEKKSRITCEYCGKPGELRDDGWLFTLCDECEKEREEKGRAPWY